MTATDRASLVEQLLARAEKRQREVVSDVAKFGHPCESYVAESRFDEGCSKCGWSEMSHDVWADAKLLRDAAAALASPPQQEKALRNIRLSAASARSFGHQVVQHPPERSIERKDKGLDDILRFCAEVGVEGSVLRGAALAGPPPAQEQEALSSSPVRTPPFHGGDSGSNPDNATKALAASSSPWQPIETVPADVLAGKGWVLVTGCNTSPLVLVAGFRPDAGRWLAYGHVHISPPTHWMPLPVPPPEAPDAR